MARIVCDLTSSSAQSRYYIKELTLISLDNTDHDPKSLHYSFKGPKKVRPDRQTFYCQKYIHGLRFSKGDLEQKDLKRVLHQFTHNGENMDPHCVIYVKGLEKCGLLRKAAGFDKNLNIINVENAPSFRELFKIYGDRISPCKIHSELPQKFKNACSQAKATAMHFWLSEDSSFQKIDTSDSALWGNANDGTPTEQDYPNATIINMEF